MKYQAVASIQFQSIYQPDILIIRLITSFSSNSYNNVPPTIMELMKDLRGFSDIVVKNVFLIELIQNIVFK